MNSRDGLQCSLDAILAHQLAKCIENDAITDAQEEVERSGDDALRGDEEERRMSAVDGVLVAWHAIASGLEEAALRNDADGARVSSGRSHEAEHSVEEAPAAVEESRATVDEMLQHTPPRCEGRQRSRL